MVNLTNKPAGRTALIEWRLGVMADFHAEVKRHGLDEAQLARRDQYVRLQGESVRAISLSPKAPLCALAVDGVELVSRIDLSGLEEQLDRAEPAGGITEGSQQERALQANLIRHALRNERRLETRIPGLAGQGIDELIFVCDELNVGAGAPAAADGTASAVTRADMIALGRQGDRYFPVFIELKFARHLTRLVEQLDAIHREMTADGVASAFGKLLAQVADVPEASIDMSRARKMMIWPGTASGVERAQTLATLEAHKLVAVQYQVRDDGGFDLACKG